MEIKVKWIWLRKEVSKKFTVYKSGSESKSQAVYSLIQEKRIKKLSDMMNQINNGRLFESTVVQM